MQVLPVGWSDSLGSSSEEEMARLRRTGIVGSIEFVVREKWGRMRLKAMNRIWAEQGV